MLTLKKVKELVEAPSHAKRTPSPKMLFEEGIVLLRREFDQGSHLTVYNSGYVLFSAGKRNTVFHIHDCCGDYAYDAAEGKGDVIEEEYFENCEWHIRALFEGERKMEDNQAKCEGAGRSNVCVSYHALSEDWSEIADRTMENLTYPREKMKERISKTVADLDIAHLTGRSIFELSGGEKQKVAFASIYAMSPSIYLLDEPSSNLDMDAIEDLRRTLELLKKQGKTILIAEHRIYYLRELVDRIAYMENGAISAVFSPSQFLSIPEEQRHSMGLRALDLSKVQPRAFAENSQKPILEVRNLSLFYKKKLVLDDLNLSAAPGEIIGIIGHNGAGKSTFSRTLCGLHTNCTGQILWDGKELNAKSRLKRSYMVMQDVSYQLFADTLEKECVFGIKHPDLDAAKQAMERLGIYEYRTHHPNTLSGGQKQRAAVAVSMVCRKDVLIFDEPTSGLDYDSMIQVAGLFQTLSKMGKVIFVVTHDYEFLAAACTRVIHLDNGKQQEDYPLSPDNLHRLHDFFLRSERRQNLEENGK